MRNFGIEFHGNHAIIKLNCKLTSHERHSLANAYPDLVIRGIDTPKVQNLTRIEGCLPSHLFNGSFSMEYKLAMKRSKIQFMQDELYHMERRQDVMADYTCNSESSPLDELPF